jgi:hypothetical protein
MYKVYSYHYGFINDCVLKLKQDTCVSKLIVSIQKCLEIIYRHFFKFSFTIILNSFTISLTVFKKKEIIKINNLTYLALYI